MQQHLHRLSAQAAPAADPVPLTFEDADGEEQTYAVPDAQPLPEEQVELKLTRETLAAAMGAAAAGAPGSLAAAGRE